MIRRRRRARLRPLQPRPPRKRIWAYNPGSAGAKALARALGVKLIKHEGSTFRARLRDTIINWGDSAGGARWVPATCINGTIGVCTNKLVFFRAMQQSANPPRCPDFGTTRQWAIEELRKKHIVCARTILTGHSGAGIIILLPKKFREEGDAYVPSAPLYTRYIEKDGEFRVHILRGEIIDIQRKIRDPNRQPTNWYVRSHHHGFIFVRGGFDTPQDVREQALRAISLSGLDFGAVDVVWNQQRGEAYVLEINTAPGLTGTTLANYKNAFTRLLT